MLFSKSLSLSDHRVFVSSMVAEHHKNSTVLYKAYPKNVKIMFEKYLKRRKESRNYRTEMLRKLNNKKHICTMQGEIINRCHKQLLILLFELFLWIRTLLDRLLIRIFKTNKQFVKILYSQLLLR